MYITASLLRTINVYEDQLTKFETIYPYGMPVTHHMLLDALIEEEFDVFYLLHLLSIDSCYTFTTWCLRRMCSRNEKENIETILAIKKTAAEMAAKVAAEMAAKVAAEMAAKVAAKNDICDC